MAPVGKGPFQLKSFRVDSQLTRQAPGWFRAAERPAVDTLVFAITPDGNVRPAPLKRDRCDIADSVAPAGLYRAAQDPISKVTTSPGMNIGYLAFNTKHPVLGKVEVRRALDMAIDKATLVKPRVWRRRRAGADPDARRQLGQRPQHQGPGLQPRQGASCSRKPASRASASASGPCPSSATTTPTAKLVAQLIQTGGPRSASRRTSSPTMGRVPAPRRQRRARHRAAGWNGDTEPANTAGQLGCGSASGTFWCNPDYSCSPKPAPARPARPARSPTPRPCAWPRSNCPGAPGPRRHLRAAPRQRQRASCCRWTARCIFDGVLPR